MTLCTHDVPRLRALVEEREAQVRAQEGNLERITDRGLEREQAWLALFALRRNLQHARERLEAALRCRSDNESLRPPTRNP